MRRALLVLCLAGIPCAPLRAEEAPAPPAPAAPPSPAPVPVPVPPRRPDPEKPAPPRVGIAWERDFEAAMRRAVAEGRPVFVAVNALVDEGETGNLYLWRETYASKEMGEATRPFVCFVANPTLHASDRRADGAEVCRRYGAGTCACHQEAMRFAMTRLSKDGETIVSPFHAVIDPDGRVVHQAEYMQGCPTPAALEAFLVALAPTRALREVWTTRDARLEALGKAPPRDLQTAAAAWLDEKDPMAAVGLVALHEQESDPFRRGAIRFALARAGPSALPAIQDVVDAATAAPEVDPDGLPGWLETAIRIDPAFGALSTARAMVRSKSAERRQGLWNHAWKAFPELPGEALTAAEVETKALLGQESVREELSALARAAGWAPTRLLRAELRAGATIAAPRGDDRDAVRAWLYESVRAGRKVDVEVAAKALARPEEEVRVAAALALRLAGDDRGVEILRAAIADPVEGPEVRAALAPLAGGDRGADPEAWADVLAPSAKGGGK